VAERCILALAHGIEGQAQLRAKLDAGAGGIGGRQHTFPEALPCRQQRVAGAEQAFVFATVRERAAMQVGGNLAQAARGLKRLVRGWLATGLLLENGLAQDLFNVGIGQLHLDGKAAQQLRKNGRAGQCALPGGDDQDAAVKVLC
jgi:hypothetical protein